MNAIEIFFTVSQLLCIGLGINTVALIWEMFTSVPKEEVYDNPILWKPIGLNTFLFVALVAIFIVNNVWMLLYRYAG